MLGCCPKATHVIPDTFMRRNTRRNVGNELIEWYYEESTGHGEKIATQLMLSSENEAPGCPATVFSSLGAINGSSVLAVFPAEEQVHPCPQLIYTIYLQSTL